MIQKNIFQSWHTKNLHPELQSMIYALRASNPDYTYHLYDDADMDNFVNEHFPGEIAECYNRLNIIVAKVDFWRYLVLYTYGGVYLDMDSYFLRPLDEFIDPDDKAVLSAEGNLNCFVQWALIFEKKHPILEKVIELIVENIKYNRFPNDINSMTGPTVYTRAIQAVQPIDTKSIRKSTNRTYRSCRVFGIDYSECICFKHDRAFLLYINKKHWSQEQNEKILLRP